MTATYKWTKEDNGEWHRRMVAAELYTYAVSADGIPRFNILPAVRVKLDKPEKQEIISSKFRAAFHCIYYQIPNASFRGVMRSDGCSFDVHYQVNTSVEESNEWLSHSLEEKFLPANEGDIDTILRSESGRIGHRQIDTEVASTFRFCVVYFTEAGNVTEIGLVALVQHYAFDGTGTYNLFNKLFVNVAKGASITDYKIKAEPEVPFFASLPEEIIKADHSTGMAELMDGFTAPHKPDSLKVLRQARPRNEIACMSESRFLFTSEETTWLLAKAKSLGVTISQLAQAAHLVALFGIFPAEQLNNVIYTGLVNVRSYAKLAPPYYGNATAPYFGSVSCQTLGESIRSGQAETVSDAQSLYSVAQELTRTVKQQCKDPLSGAFAVGIFTDEIMKHFDPSKPPSDLPISIIADGLVDRYIQHRYDGIGDSFRVTDAHLFVLDPSPVVQARTSTFDNRLSLSLSFNANVYQQEEVDQMSRHWGESLRFCVKLARNDQFASVVPRCRQQHTATVTSVQ